jgi:hypothetical protein
MSYVPGLPLHGLISKSYESQRAKPIWIALSLPSRCNNTLGDNFVDDVWLARVTHQCSGFVERIAKYPHCFRIECRGLEQVNYVRLRSAASYYARSGYGEYWSPGFHWHRMQFRETFVHQRLIAFVSNIGCPLWVISRH